MNYGSNQRLMKKIGIVLFFQIFAVVQLLAQDSQGEVASGQIPFQIQLRIGFTSVYIVLALLFLMLFAFYPRQRLHLFFGLFNLFLFFSTFDTQSFYGEPSVLRNNIDGLISRLIGMNILLFIAYALNRVRPILWWFVAFVLFIDFPLNVVLGKKYDVINYGVHSVFTVICTWLAIIAFTTRKREDWLIGIIALASVAINLSDLLLFFAKIDFTAYAGFVPFTVTISALCYLALRYSKASISLEQQLVQVKNLSEENVRREQEKQQLLATQNEMLEQQVKQRTSEITAQKETLEHTLKELRLTQAQLVQSEKMASLGELTAGIAHEIQNPLNFVNNFSEVNKELIEEVKNEKLKDKSERNEELELQLLNDIEQNLEKIWRHGKRADDIVKGMLLHSQKSSGQQEPTDINKLADEYLRLAYHGLRAKDKTFNADIKTEFDDSIGKINIVQQDIARVILNLLNNAFYAVGEKAKLQSASGGYEPRVIITTKKLDGKVEITVTDNGNGIPKTIIDKIFHPFFTTKPSGQGTGLGLSLAYDIVKAHGGEISMETKEGEGSKFICHLPLS